MQLNKSYFGRKKAYFSRKTNHPKLLKFEGDGNEQEYLSAEERKQVNNYLHHAMLKSMLFLYNV